MLASSPAINQLQERVRRSLALFRFGPNRHHVINGCWDEEFWAAFTFLNNGLANRIWKIISGGKWIGARDALSAVKTLENYVSEHGFDIYQKQLEFARVEIDEKDRVIGELRLRLYRQEEDIFGYAFEEAVGLGRRPRQGAGV